MCKRGYKKSPFNLPVPVLTVLHRLEAKKPVCQERCSDSHFCDLDSCKMLPLSFFMVTLLASNAQAVETKTTGANLGDLELTFPIETGSTQEFPPSEDFTLAKRAHSLLGDMIWQTVEKLVDGCHFVLVTSDSHRPFLKQVIRNSLTALQPFSVIDLQVMDTSYKEGMRKAISGESTTVCRVYVIDLTVNENNSVLEFLETSRLWLWPEAKVVIAGIRQKVGDVLLHSVFRNTFSLFYLGLSSDFLNFSVEEFRTLPWKGTKTLTSGNQLDQVKSLEGHLVRMVSIVYFPYVDYEMRTDRPGSPVTLRDSLDKRIFEIITSRLNFTYEVRAPSDLQWGVLTKSENWTGLLGSIQQNKADMTTVIAPNPARLAVIDVTRVYQADKMTIVSLKPQLLPQYLVIIRPFTGNVWLCLLACIVGWGLSLWLFQKARSQFSGKPALTLNRAIFFSWVVILQVPLSRQPADFISQTLIGWWLLVSLVIATAYRSSLIAHLAVQSKTTPIDSFEDMIRQKDWKWGAEEKMFTGAIVAYFQTTTDPVAKTVHKYLQKLSEEEALQKVLKGGFSYMHWYNHISSVIQSYYTDRLGNSPFYIGQKGTTMLTDFGWGFRRGAPYKDRFNLMTNRLIEAGIISYWTNDVMALRVKENGRRRDRQQAHNSVMYHENSQIILHLSHLMGVFLLLLLGYTLASLILLSEVMLVKWQQKKTPLRFLAQNDEGN
ncbi:glutamate receptor ionotropic, delta-1-like isoform X2 [Macrobrachium rosenbergii]|uniref:glutamate receptor ionotropic, delta-1-like isoform X2 n=2 Tax=Macrobrachium rosenbergii TaxID=79674 RepID=UPI0034D3C170